MELRNSQLKQWSEAEKSVRKTHEFYLFLFGYLVMTVYLHFIDLRDGSYDWAYYSWILMTFSLVWMAAMTFSFSLKSRMILKEMKKNRFNNPAIKNQNHGNK